MSRTAEVAIDQALIDATPVEERPTVDSLAVTIASSLERAMQSLALHGDASVGVLLSDDARLRELNLAYRHRDSTTDVLSFRSADGSEESEWYPESVPPYLGDIAISMPEARRGAQKAGYTLEAELCLLAVHGLLHLIGHDDSTTEGADEMERLEVRLGVRAGAAGAAEAAY